jgi:hypothetical protein
MVTPLPADQQNNVQIVSKTDPVTGKVTQQVVQTITNTETGETTQLPVETSTDECEILAVPPPSKSGRGVQKTKQPKPKVEVVTVEDPITGEPVKQLVQIVTDAKTGKTIQIPLPMADIQADNLDEGWIHIHIFFYKTPSIFTLYFSLI